MARCVVRRRLRCNAAARLLPSRSIAVICWRALEAAVTPAALTRIRLWETGGHYVDYHGT
jgi:hypothetical protein